MSVSDGPFFIAEAKAVDLNFIRTHDDKNKFLIFLDSLAIDDTSSKNPQI